MYKIIIVDDEPLILAGIAALINWEDHDCAIVGKATNGPSAYDMIMEQKPDILITDIRMPVLNGLELVEKCKQSGLDFAFIVLTNLEEFQLVKKALSLGATDYLVKIDLSEEALLSALSRAKETCRIRMRKGHQLLPNDGGGADMVLSPKEQLLRMILSPDEDTLVELPESIKGNYSHPFVMLFSLRPIHINFDPDENSYDFHQISKQILDILGGISGRYFEGSILSEYRNDTFLLAGSVSQGTVFEKTVTDFCQKILVALKTYFELSAIFGVSQIKEDLKQLPGALFEALTALEYYYYDSSAPVVFYEGQQIHHSKARDFNINLFKKDMSAAVTQNNSEKLADIFNQVLGLFAENKPNKEQATSACINLYTYLYSALEVENNSYQDIFPYTINVAEHLNHFSSLSDILQWLQGFCDKLCRLLDDRKLTRSDTLVEQTRQYIEGHYREKLALADIAESLNISAGHLSNTYRKFTGVTLSDYIAEVKIEKAKELIDTHQYLMYEISDQLGFDNAYYFSKVFKKVTGISPKQYENRKMV